MKSIGIALALLTQSGFADALETTDLALPLDLQPVMAAHQDLAQNKVNKALCAFQNLTTPLSMPAIKKASAAHVADHPTDVTALALDADIKARHQEFDKALALLTKALEHASDPSGIYNQRAVVRAALGEFDGAHEDIAKAIAHDPNVADYYQNKGMLMLLSRSAAKGAKRAFETALKLDPTSSLALNGLGAVAIVDGEYETAKTLLEKAKSNAPCAELAVVQFNSWVLLRKQQFEELAKAQALMANANTGVPIKQQMSARSSALALSMDLTSNQLGAMWSSVRKSPEAQVNRNNRANLADISTGRTLNGARLTTDIVGGIGQAVATAVPNKPAKLIGRGVSGASSALSYAFDQSIKNASTRIGNRNDQSSTLIPQFGNLDKTISQITSPAMSTFNTTPKIPAPNTAATGGIQTENKTARVDTGDWEVLTWPTLLYVIHAVDAEEG